MVWAVVITERSGKDLTDYQVRVEVTDSQFFSECTEQRFVEFYDSDKTTLLSHYTEIFDVANNKAVFWVKVPSIPANSTKMIYLNVNTERTEDLSNPDAVFDLWDDFEGSELDTTKWQTQGGAEVTISNSVASIKSGTVEHGDVISIDSFSADIVIEFKYRVNSGSWAGFVWMYADEDNMYRLLQGNSGGDNRLFGIIKGGTRTNWEVWVSTDYDVHSWHVYRVVSSVEKGQEVYVDGELKTSNTNAELTSGKIGFGAYNQYCDVDWVRVRKYTEPEPSVIVVKGGATATLDFKRIVAKALAGKIANILNGDPRIRLYSGGSLVKEITAGAKLRKEDTANKWFIVMFLFVDDSSDAYTTDSQELIFPHPDGDYVAFTQSESFEKVADEPLPLRWEIYVPWTVDEEGWGEVWP